MTASTNPYITPLTFYSIGNKKEFHLRHLRYFLSFLLFKNKKHKINFFDHADDNALLSNNLIGTDRLLINTGSFGSWYYRFTTFLENLKKAIETGTNVTYIFGPAINIHSIELFKLFNYCLSGRMAEIKGKDCGKLELYYRRDIDIKNEWDQRHFCHIKKGSIVSLRAETMHTEYIPDSDKEFIIFRCPEGQESNYKYNKYSGGENIFDLYLKGFESIRESCDKIENLHKLFEIVKSKEETTTTDGKGQKRFLGFVDINRDRNSGPKPCLASDQDIKFFLAKIFNENLNHIIVIRENQYLKHNEYK